MRRIEGNAGITDVARERYSHVAKIGQDLDANGREKALLRGALAKQFGAAAGMGGSDHARERLLDDAHEVPEVPARLGRPVPCGVAYAQDRRGAQVGAEYVHHLLLVEHADPDRA